MPQESDSNGLMALLKGIGNVVQQFAKLAGVLGSPDAQKGLAILLVFVIFLASTFVALEQGAHYREVFIGGFLSGLFLLFIIARLVKIDKSLARSRRRSV